MTTYLKWFRALLKRLFLKPSFVVILLFIPIITLAFTTNVTKEKSGIITCVITSKDMSCDIYNSVKDELVNNTSSMLFYETDGIDTALEDVKNGKADCAWVFEDNLENRIKLFVLSGSYKPNLVEAFTVNDDVFQKLSREKLYSYLYKSTSFDVFLNYMNDKFPDEDFTRDELKEIFDKAKKNLNDEIIKMEFLGEPEKKIEDTNYLLSPLKGILSVAMLVCLLAAMMYSLQDEAAGKFASFPKYKRLFLHLSGIFAAAICVSVVILLSRMATGDFKSLSFEIASMLSYIASASAFSLFVGVVCKTPKRMCILLPVISLCSLVACPIFVNIAALKPLSFIIPAYYYLMSSVDVVYIYYSIIYSAIVFVLSNVIYRLTTK